MLAITLGEVGGIAALALLITVAVAILAFLGAGLFEARSLIRRELAAYFVSPIAYVVLFGFLLITGLLFAYTLDQLTTRGPKGVEWPMQMIFGDDYFWFFFLFIPPLLTMRLFAEERGTGTLEMLMTAPLREWQVVLSKYVACFAFYLVLCLPTLVYLPALLDLKNFHLTPMVTLGSMLLLGGVGLVIAAVVFSIPRLGTWARLVAVVFLLVGLASIGYGSYRHFEQEPASTSASASAETATIDSPAASYVVSVDAGIDPFPALSTYLGLTLAGAMFLAIGLLVSSLVRSQMVAALISLVVSLVFIVAGFFIRHLDLDTGDPWYRLAYFFTVPLHFYRDFTRGIIDTRHLVLYGTVTAVCLFLTVRSLESRR
jgi:ABC-type transport system involved in multi-copper enzyme maturation permease subunit